MIKICGITKVEQAQAITLLGATALGFICVSRSPRYIQPLDIKKIIAQINRSVLDTDNPRALYAQNILVKPLLIGVFANAPLATIKEVVNITGLTGVQLHGDELPQYCQELREILPEINLIKALRIKDSQSLHQTEAYFNVVDTLLLDAYDPNVLGGTGKTLNWEILKQFRPSLPWLLAGGLTPDNIAEALSQVKPDGIDLSSGVERSPGDKDLNKVNQLFHNLKDLF